MYNHKEIEQKWQEFWSQNQTYIATDNSSKPKKYVLMEFPYPSGAGLHMGHLRGYVAGDVTSRYFRMGGHEVLYPIGWDAFGLPAENFAIKTGIHPKISTAQNIANAKRQFINWGIGFDWSRELNTTDPEYYKWTQWIFLQLFKKGLAFEQAGLINWCPKDKTGLANEEVIDGKCERCGTVVEKRHMKQWYLRITDYAQKLLDGLKDLNWPESVKLQQANWIGRSEGALIKFPLAQGSDAIEVFTTRPDTLLGATYIVLAPDHPLVQKITNQEHLDEVNQYAQASLVKPEIERTALDKEKTGVFTGAHAVNPATEEEIQIWVADYVLSGYGTGAIMAVPAHDERDFEFAKKYKLPIRKVVAQPAGVQPDSECYTGEGTLVNSGEYSFMDTQEARKHITADFGVLKIQYKLRDWVFSRQRYWGEPIPLVHCAQCGVVAVPEDQLPVTLPEVEKYEPTGTGESPLAAIESWVKTTCPQCQGPAQRETNTMPQWAGSSWYFLRYIDPHNKAVLAAPDKLKYWMPVDVYFGGMEHTTLHLLYSRFWNQFLFDIGIVPQSEPYIKRVPHGIILGPDGEKMSKSRGNVVNPDDVIEHYGADALRMYEMFLGPHGDVISWNDQGIVGVSRFLDRVNNLMPKPDQPNTLGIHKLIKKITDDLESYKFNTCISSFMEFLNSNSVLNKHDLEILAKLLAPFAPHMAEEIWQTKLGYSGSIHLQPWPQYDPALLAEDQVTVAIQVLGKTRATITVKMNATQEEVQAVALADANIQTHTADKQIIKTIFVPNRLINFVIQ